MAFVNSNSVIHKQEVYHGLNHLYVPKDTKFIAFRQQSEKMYVWYTRPADAPCGMKQVLIVGTGHDFTIDDEVYYIGTIEDSVSYIWHAFART